MLLVTANIFQPLIDVFETVLKFFHGAGISWGFSIVLLTVAVRALLIPLTFRQIKSMVRMQGLSPQMKEIQKKYKQDKKRQQEEMMKFYRENNVNPLASCLPLLFQFPVFIALYYMLRKSLRSDICPKVQHAFQAAYAHAHSVSLAAAAGQTRACGSSSASHFLFVSDLTAKATGIELGLLIVLYIGSQLGSSLLMSAATMDPTQRKVMMFMPLIFVLFVIRFPAGLLVYWITTNLWTVAQQYTVRRYIGPVQAVSVAGGDGGPLTGPGDFGDAGDGGGGLGGRLRARLAAVQDGESAGGSTSSSDNGGGRAAAVTRTASGRASKSANGNGSGAASGAKARSSSNGTGSTPPRPPRKKKKRSGRRR